MDAVKQQMTVVPELSTPVQPSPAPQPAPRKLGNAPFPAPIISERLPALPLPFPEAGPPAKSLERLPGNPARILPPVVLPDDLR
jgi:hypothetical protein